MDLTAVQLCILLYKVEPYLSIMYEFMHRPCLKDAGHDFVYLWGCHFFQFAWQVAPPYFVKYWPYHKDRDQWNLLYSKYIQTLLLGFDSMYTNAVDGVLLQAVACYCSHAPIAESMTAFLSLLCSCSVHVRGKSFCNRYGLISGLSGCVRATTRHMSRDNYILIFHSLLPNNPHLATPRYSFFTSFQSPISNCQMIWKISGTRADITIPTWHNAIMSNVKRTHSVATCTWTHIMPKLLVDEINDWHCKYHLLWQHIARDRIIHSQIKVHWLYWLILGVLFLIMALLISATFVLTVEDCLMKGWKCRFPVSKSGCKCLKCWPQGALT